MKRIAYLWLLLCGLFMLFIIPASAVDRIDLGHIDTADISLPMLEIIAQDGPKTVARATPVAAKIVDRIILADGAVVERIEVDSVVVLGNILPAVDPSSTGAGGSIDDERWDSSGGIYAYLKLYFDRTKNGGEYYDCLTRVSGGWKIYDSSCRITKYMVLYGYSGTTMLYYSLSPSFDIMTNFTDYVQENRGGPKRFTATITATIERGNGANGTWELSLTVAY